MILSYAGCWGSILLRGIALMLFGAVALAAPASALELTVLMLALVLLVSGANSVSTGLRLRALSTNAWLLMLEGALEITLGVLAFIRPGPFILTLAFFVAALALLSGLVQLGIAWRHRRGRVGRVLTLALASVAFAALLAWQPYAFSQGLTMPVGAAALVLGGLLTLAGWDLRRLRRRTGPFAAPHTRPEMLRARPRWAAR